jgi:hypothetical protein
VATALGRAGWVVYVTARSSGAGRTGHLPGTVEQAAAAAIPDPGQHKVGAAYAMAKAADDRLALVAGAQFRQHWVACVAVHPDWVRTEGVLQFAGQVDLAGSQSPEGVGRAIAALAGDPRTAKPHRPGAADRRPRNPLRNRRDQLTAVYQGRRYEGM